MNKLFVKSTRNFDRRTRTPDNSHEHSQKNDLNFNPMRSPLVRNEVSLGKKTDGSNCTDTFNQNMIMESLLSFQNESKKDFLILAKKIKKIQINNIDNQINSLTKNLYKTTNHIKELKPQITPKNVDNVTLKEDLLRMMKNIKPVYISNEDSPSIYVQNQPSKQRFERHFQSSDSNSVLEETKLFSCLCQKLNGLKAVQKETQSNFQNFTQSFLPKIIQMLREGVNVFVQEKIRKLKLQLEEEKTAYVKKIDEETLIKLDCVKRKYENSENEIKSKLEQEIKKNQSIEHLYKGLLGEEIEKNRLASVHLNDKKRHFLRSKDIGIKDTSCTNSDFINQMSEKLKSLKVFYEAKFIEYKKRIEQILEEKGELEEVYSTPKNQVQIIREKNNFEIFQEAQCNFQKKELEKKLEEYEKKIKLLKKENENLINENIFLKENLKTMEMREVEYKKIWEENLPLLFEKKKLEKKIKEIEQKSNI